MFFIQFVFVLSNMKSFSVKKYDRLFVMWGIFGNYLHIKVTILSIHTYKKHVGF